MFQKKILFVATSFIVSCSIYATQLTVEELRLEQAAIKIPDVINTFATNMAYFKQDWKNSKNYQTAKEVVSDHSQQLWLDATKKLQSTSVLDDRPLHWARLAATKIMRSQACSFSPTANQLHALIELFEQGSRGRTDLEYTKTTDKKILLTGFDPFLLDRNINQSNPSGIAALLLDGQVISYNGITAEINTAMGPVRYEDFDQGTIESLLAPYYALNNVDMVVTVSMAVKNLI